MPDYLMGEFNGGCTAADGRRERPLLAAILQEANEDAHQLQADRLHARTNFRSLWLQRNIAPAWSAGPWQLVGCMRGLGGTV